LLSAPFRRAKKPVSKPGPVSRYDKPELIEALRTIWMASDQLCSKRLKAALPLWLPHYATSFHPLSADTLSLLDSISAATIDRLLKPILAKAGRRRLSGTKLGTLLIKFTRSRPYHSNDNAHVEQKNWSCVRQLFGYDRLGDPKMVKLMNDLYANEFSLFTNFFCPTLKLVSKAREGSKWLRKHSKPITPAQRLLELPDIPNSTKEKLALQIKELNPFLIQRQIQRKLRAIFKLLR
jgi:hypothetical protein